MKEIISDILHVVYQYKYVQENWMGKHTPLKRAQINCMIHKVLIDKDCTTCEFEVHNICQNRNFYKGLI